MSWRNLEVVVIAIACMHFQAASSCAQEFLTDWLANGSQRAAANDSFLETDGPTFTRSSATVPQEMVQLESRYLNTSRPTVNSAPQLDLRIGLTSNVEFRLEWAGVDSASNFRSAEDIEVGFKFAVTKKDGWVPQSALLAEILTPTGYGQNAIGTVAPELDYIYNWSLTEKIGFGGSTGMIIGQPGASNVAQFYQSLLINRTWLDGHVVTYGEAYSFFGSGTNQGTVQPSLASGVLLRPTHNLQFDWHITMGLDHEAPGLGTGVGFCFRF